MGKQSIKTILTSNVISVSPDALLSEVVSLMERNKISCLVVLNDKHPIGIITERDLVLLASRGRTSKDVAIKEVMSSSVITANIEIDLFEAYRLLEMNNIRHLVVVDHNDEINGVVTQTDIINSLGLEYFIELKNISTIMTKHVVTLKKEDSTRDALSLMARHSISCVVVVEDDNHPAGVLTESDVVRLFRRGVDLKTLPVKEVMSQPVITIFSGVTVHDAAGIMSQKKIRRLVITGQDGRTLGLVTQYDIIKNFEFKYIDFLKEIIKGKEKIIEETEKILNEKIVLDNILRYSTDMAIIATDIDYRIVYYNPSAEKIFGYKAEDVVGERVLKFHKQEKVDLFRFKKALETIQEQGAYKYIFKLKKEEEARLVGATISGIRDKEHNLIGFVLMGQDITKRLAAEEETRRNYDRQAILNQLLSLALENISLQDILRRTLDLILSIPWLAFESKGAIFLTEDNSDVLALRIQKELPLELQKRCARIEFGKCLCGRAAINQKIEFADCIDARHLIEYEGMEPHGHYCVPIIFSGNLLGIINIYVKEAHERNQMEEAFLTSVANTLAGVIVRKRTEENLIKVNTQLQTLIHAIPDVVFFKDSQRRHLVVNRACEEFIGLKQAEIEGSTLDQVLPPALAEQCRMADEAVLRDLKPVHVEEEFVGMEGEKIILDTIRVPLYDEQGEAVGLVGVCRDISERKKMEAELLKVRKLESVGILAGGIAHDFNNLLMAILGNISLAKYYTDKKLNQEEIIDVLEGAETASMRASELTKLLITFSKGGTPVKRVASASDLLKSAVSFALNDADVTCNLIIPVGLWPVEVDEGQLKWVVNNVVCNAQEATPTGGIINVIAQNITVSEKEGFSLKEGKYVKISIQDTGVGISKENLVKIFDPYFTTKEMSSQKGMGLGLSICYSIIKSHGGTIAVESEIGVGTTVDIYLPT